MVERQIPVGGFALDERVARKGVAGMDKFLGREGAPALLALVAISTLGVAAGTFTHDVTVGEELTGFLVVELLALQLDELAVIVELAEEVAGQLVMGGAGGAAIDIERDAEALE